MILQEDKIEQIKRLFPLPRPMNAFRQFTLVADDDLPISLATSTNFDSVREISTILMPRFASSFAYSLPMPSVEPVMTGIENEWCQMVNTDSHLLC